MSDTVDKVTGKIKQAAGDLAGDRSLHDEGRKEERKGEVKEEVAVATAGICVRDASRSSTTAARGLRRNPGYPKAVYDSVRVLTPGDGTTGVATSRFSSAVALIRAQTEFDARTPAAPRCAGVVGSRARPSARVGAGSRPAQTLAR